MIHVIDGQGRVYAQWTEERATPMLGEQRMARLAAGERVSWPRSDYPDGLVWTAYDSELDAVAREQIKRNARIAARQAADKATEKHGKIKPRAAPEAETAPPWEDTPRDADKDFD